MYRDCGTPQDERQPVTQSDPPDMEAQPTGLSDMAGYWLDDLLPGRSNPFFTFERCGKECYPAHTCC